MRVEITRGHEWGQLTTNIVFRLRLRVLTRQKKSSLDRYKTNFNVIAPAKENREKRGTGRNGPADERLLIDGRGKHGQGSCSKKEVIESPPPF